MLGAGSQNHRSRFIRAAGGHDLQAIFFFPDAGRLVQFDLGAERGGLLQQPIRQLIAADGLVAREVFNPGRVGDLSAEALLFQNQHLFISPEAVDGRRQARRTGADDHNIIHGFVPPFRRSFRSFRQ